MIIQEVKFKSKKKKLLHWNIINFNTDFEYIDSFALSWQEPGNFTAVRIRLSS